MTVLSPLDAWQHAVDTQGFQPDEAQRNAALHLQACWQALHDGKRGGAVKGVYLWGPVGRGKTWLMDRFYERAGSCAPPALPSLHALGAPASVPAHRRG